jgi:hypothetical protein
MYPIAANTNTINMLTHRRKVFGPRQLPTAYLLEHQQAVVCCKGSGTTGKLEQQDAKRPPTCSREENTLQILLLSRCFLLVISLYEECHVAYLIIDGVAHTLYAKEVTAGSSALEA